ncbi:MULTISPECIES: hypothetical protein [Brevibacillus]|uniref:hypothetical protein n=1 Tax=Brevibacillus sp. FSL K6-2834 TaxID=2954680 RepID=UPI0031581AF3
MRQQTRYCHCCSPPRTFAVFETIVRSLSSYTCTDSVFNSRPGFGENFRFFHFLQKSSRTANCCLSAFTVATAIFVSLICKTRKNTLGAVHCGAQGGLMASNDLYKINFYTVDLGQQQLFVPLRAWPLPSGESFSSVFFPASFFLKLVHIDYTEGSIKPNPPSFRL